MQAICKLNVGIIGSGPSAFYTAQRLLKKHPNVWITFYEKLQQPFGLVKYGVAPDHAEIKNCIHKFQEILADERVTLKTNVEITSLSSLISSENDVVVVSVGAEGEKRLGITGEEICLKNNSSLFSSRNFVGWYNGHPQMHSHYHESISSSLLASRHVLIVGNGNVALDIARVLLKDPFKSFINTDISNEALKTLKSLRLEKVSLIGRRGPFQASFTPKELREVLHLDTCYKTSSPPIQDFLFDFTFPMTADSKLERHTKRMVDIWLQLQNSVANGLVEKKKHLEFLFMKQPNEILFHSSSSKISGLKVEKNEFFTPIDRENKAAYFDQSLAVRGTGEFESIDCDLIISSIGYSVQNVFNLPITNQGLIPNNRGRVEKFPGIYVTGWCKTGPKGVLASTLSSAYETADTIIEDYHSLANQNPSSN